MDSFTSFEELLLHARLEADREHDPALLLPARRGRPAVHVGGDVRKDVVDDLTRRLAQLAQRSVIFVLLRADLEAAVGLAAVPFRCDDERRVVARIAHQRLTQVPRDVARTLGDVVPGTFELGLLARLDLHVERDPDHPVATVRSGSHGTLGHEVHLTQRWPSGVSLKSVFHFVSCPLRSVRSIIACTSPSPVCSTRRARSCSPRRYARTAP